MPLESRKTVTHLLGLATKKEISWKILVPVIDELASTFEKSKEIIRVLLNELEHLSESVQNPIAENNITETEASELQFNYFQN